MNILKHMEAVFVATVVLAVSGSYLVDTLPQAYAKPLVSASAIPTVVVSAKRMSAQEKQQAARAQAGQPASRI